MKKSIPLALALTTAFTISHAADLQIRFEGVSGDKGILLVALSDQAGFLKPGQQIAGASAKPGEPIAIFRNLPAGEYAVSAFHDLNENGTLDRNMFGSPLEPFGFSNDAIGNMGPPTFNAAAIKVGAENQTIVIKLH